MKSQKTTRWGIAMIGLIFVVSMAFILSGFLWNDANDQTGAITFRVFVEPFDTVMDVTGFEPLVDPVYDTIGMIATIKPDTVKMFRLYYHSGGQRHDILKIRADGHDRIVQTNVAGI